ncbi:MAG: TIGR00282 family metallophosphoesterase [Chloroflexi bacterium]|nr:TIGR00282 family metallophosphoesterase [Chloroflexota bacterium]
MNFLLIGDVVGRPGRQAIHHFLPGLRRDYDLNLVIANGENAAGGFGLTLSTAMELFNAGVDVVTSGNHIWAQSEILPYLQAGELPILRPLNYPPGVPGRGYLITGETMIINLIGRTFIGEFDCPFRTMDKLLSELDPKPKNIILDFHAEATSEKGALGYYLDGRVSAVLGTHTHVGTIDSRILPKGTAFVTDVGMTGPSESVIGDDVESVLRRFLTKMPHRLSVGRGKPVLNAVLVRLSDENGAATGIERICLKVE